MNRLCILLGAATILGAAAVQAHQPLYPKKLVEPVEAEVRFTDDSVVRMIVLQDYLDVVTKYGMLKVPITDIQSIDFGVHWPAGLQQKIAQAIDQLGGDNYKMRETAFRNLVAWGPSAFPQLSIASKASEDPETIKRTMMALDQIRAKHPSRNLRVREDDIIMTPGFSIVGRITTQTIRARNENFGDMELKVATLRSVKWLGGSHETEVSIDANRFGSSPNQWMDTGFEARSIGRLIIVAAGTVDLWPQPGGGAVYNTTPKGFRGAVGVGQQLPGTLLGKIGDDGQPFIIGELYEGSPGRDGKLFLHIVPSPWGNASAGTYQVRISARGE
jgi:hypothetical protein